MDLYTFALWLAIGLVFLTVTGVIAIGLGKVFALQDRVLWLELFADDVIFELASREHGRELGLLSRRLEAVAADVDELHSRPESEAR